MSSASNLSSLKSAETISFADYFLQFFPDLITCYDDSMLACPPVQCQCCRIELLPGRARAGAASPSHLEEVGRDKEVGADLRLDDELLYDQRSSEPRHMQSRANGGRSAGGQLA